MSTRKKTKKAPEIADAAAFVQALALAVEHGALPGVIGIDDHGGEVLADHNAWTLTLILRDESRILVNVVGLPAAQEARPA